MACSKEKVNGILVGKVLTHGCAFHHDGKCSAINNWLCGKLTGCGCPMELKVRLPLMVKIPKCKLSSLPKILFDLKKDVYIKDMAA